MKFTIWLYHPLSFFWDSCLYTCLNPCPTVFFVYLSREDPLDVALQEFDEKDAENVSFGKKSRAASARKRSDSYDFTDARQMLGKYCQYLLKVQWYIFVFNPYNAEIFSY